ncbi:hypothetical protein [Microbispora sp. NPDC046933]|uniref:hypothetical protein n=1 Tax=Microbispora sp. NPDC046933 TaxID=3155618 RepID=UPI0033EA4F46
MSHRIFRGEALRRHAAQREQRSRTLEPGPGRFVVLWVVVVLLVAVLSLLTWPLLSGGGSGAEAGAGVTVHDSRGGGK